MYGIRKTTTSSLRTDRNTTRSSFQSVQNTARSCRGYVKTPTGSTRGFAARELPSPTSFGREDGSGTRRFAPRQRRYGDRARGDAHARLRSGPPRGRSCACVSARTRTPTRPRVERARTECAHSSPRAVAPVQARAPVYKVPGSARRECAVTSPALVSPLGTPLPRRPHQKESAQGGRPIRGEVKGLSFRKSAAPYGSHSLRMRAGTHTGSGQLTRHNSSGCASRAPHHPDEIVPQSGTPRRSTNSPPDPTGHYNTCTWVQSSPAAWSGVGMPCLRPATSPTRPGHPPPELSERIRSELRLPMPPLHNPEETTPRER